MIDEYLGEEGWDEAPETMAFEKAYVDILEESAELVSFLRDGRRISAESAIAAQRLYIIAPAIVNVALNYKICVEHGLPLHPTIYFELAEAGRYRIEHQPSVIEKANLLYLASIDLGRSAYRLESDFADQAKAFEALLPEEMRRFVYTGGRDDYSWRGAQPRLIAALAEDIRAAKVSGFDPGIIVAAAHGAIMPALLLSEYLCLPLYCIRFSMFKRKDKAPIVSASDEIRLSSWKESSALVYDEDVAGGTTLELLAGRMAPLFAATKTACTIRHGGSSFAPDFVARLWWD